MAMARERMLETPSIRVILGTNVYRLRVMKMPKWSQGDLADRAGVSVETVRLIEQGRDPERRNKSPRLETVGALADALGVLPGELLRWDEATRVYLDANPSHLKAIVGEGRGTDGQAPLLRAAH